MVSCGGSIRATLSLCPTCRVKRRQHVRPGVWVASERKIRTQWQHVVFSATAHYITLHSITLQLHYITKTQDVMLLYCNVMQHTNSQLVLDHPSQFLIFNSALFIITPSSSSTCPVHLQLVQSPCTISAPTGKPSSNRLHRTTRRICSAPSTSTAVVRSSHTPMRMLTNARRRSERLHTRTVSLPCQRTPTWRTICKMLATLHLHRPRYMRQEGRCETAKSAHRTCHHPQEREASRSPTRWTSSVV